MTAGADQLERALDHAVLLPLLAAVAHATGDDTCVDPRLRPDPALLASSAQGGLDDGQVALARDLAREGIGRLLAERPTAPPPVDDDRLAALLSGMLGVADLRPYLGLAREELALDGDDPRRPRWSAAELAPGRTLTVGVIGAGMSGLLAAHRLAQAGLEVEVWEKNPDLGGTWYENTYPGCRVDNPSLLYSYSFEQRSDWPQHYSPQATLLAYLRGVAERHDLLRRIAFGTEVVAAAFDEAAGRWEVTLRQDEGTRTTTVDVLVSAVGQLNRPNVPRLAGADSFAGPSFHSARWDHAVDLAGRRVGVIGTGASGVQLIPEVAEQAAHVTVFQRHPPWLAPTPDYLDPVDPALSWLHAVVPGYRAWHRFWMFWLTSDGALDHVRVDPAWSGGPAAVSARNDLWRQVLTAYLEDQFADRPDLLEQVVPSYPVAAKRVLRDDGRWAQTLKRPDVSLVRSPIAQVVADGIDTEDGAHHELDVLVYATGFQAARFLAPMRITGRGGEDLHERWAGEPRAFLGTSVPGFPNLFLLYGPNTNLVVNGSIVFVAECQVRYVLDCLRLLLCEGAAAMTVRPAVHREDNAALDEANARMAWGASDVSSWYRSASGRISQNWPYRLLDLWERTRVADPEHYELL